MCKAMEKRITDEKIRIAARLIQRGKDTLEEISDLTGLTIDEIKEIKEELKPVSA